MSDGLPFAGNNNDSRDLELNDYDRERKIHKLLNESSDQIQMSTRTLSTELCCPICLDLLTNTMTTKECLHRFCADCITTALLRGNKECPTCRKKLVSKRSLRPDPNFDSLIEKIWPDRQLYELMQSKSMEKFSQQNNIDSLRNSIEEGMKAQAATRRQRVTGSYDAVQGVPSKRRKRNADGELVDADDDESIDGSSMIDEAENAEVHAPEPCTTEIKTEEGNCPSVGVPGLQASAASDMEVGNVDAVSEEEFEDAEDELTLEEWEQIAKEENIDEIPDTDIDKSDSGSEDSDDSSDDSSSSATTESAISNLTVSEPSDDNTLPAQNGMFEMPEEAPKVSADCELPAGVVSLSDRMHKWFAEAPSSPSSESSMNDQLVRSDEDDLMDVSGSDIDIEAEFLPSASLMKKQDESLQALTAPRYIRTKYDTSMLHIAQFLRRRVLEDTLDVYKDYQDSEPTEDDLDLPEYFYVFSRQGGHHCRRIFLHETMHTAHGAATRDEHLVIFFDVHPPSLSSDKQSVLESVIPKDFLSMASV